ncbi:MAG: DUF58 domain-containing protein [Spirochaetaceae bacterium]|nr:DUF58 domain-containing protein [Spirochaetaceae bacterium]
MRDALLGLTTRGRSFVAAGVAVLAAATATSQDDLLRIAVLLIALPVISALVVSRTRYRLSSGRRLASPRTAAGQESAVTLRLDNISRLPTGLLLVEDRIPYVLGSRPRFVLDRVEPRGRREVTYTVRSDVRGRYQLGPLSLRLTDPFGMCELHRAFTSQDTLMVTPLVHPLPAVSLSGEWTGSGESRSRAIASAGDDDAGTREYRQGDDLRRVHWRSTARLGQLMVRREEQPWQARCTLLLDSRSRAHGGEGPGSSFEWAVSAAASVGVHLVRHGYFVRLLTDTGAHVAGSDPGLDGGSSDVEGSLLDALAVVTTSENTSLRDAGASLRRGGGDGLLVAVLGSVDPEEAHLLARLRHGSTAAIAVLLETDTWTAASTRARAAARASYEGSAALLRASGWRVISVRAGQSLPDRWQEAAYQHSASVRAAAVPAPSVPAASSLSSGGRS